MKLKALLALTAALSFGGALAQDATAPAPVAPAITDVPAGHWAKDAVDELVARRIIIGFPDGTFRGSENLTRYQAAVMIQRLLEQLATGVAAPITDPALLTTLQNAVQELASDLAALGVRVADLEDNGVARDDFAALEDRVSGFDDNLSDLTSRVEALEGATPPTNPDGTVDLTPIEDRIAALEDSQSAQDDTLTDHEDRIAALEDTVANLPAEFDPTDLTDRLSALEDSQATQDDTLADVDGRLSALEDSQTAQDDLIADLDSRLGDAEASLDEVRAGLDDNTAADADLQAAIDELRDGLDATTTASDTALAQARDLQDALDALTERTDTLEGDFSDLSASVESNTSSITALNDLTVLLNQDILDLQDQVAATLARLDDTDAANAAQFEAVNGSIADLSSSVDQRFDDFQADVDSRFDSVYTELDGLRAFDDVIRRDVDVLTGRVTVNETQIADLNNKVTGIDNRLIKLENNLGFSVSGTLTFNYYQSALNGRDFDIDRIIPGTSFSTGNSTNGDGADKGARPYDFSDLGRPGPVTGTNPQQPSNLTGLFGYGTALYSGFTVNYTTGTPAVAATLTSGAADGLIIKDSTGATVGTAGSAASTGASGNTINTVTLPAGATYVNTTATALANRSREGNSTLNLNLTLKLGNGQRPSSSDNRNFLAPADPIVNLQSVTTEFGIRGPGGNDIAINNTDPQVLEIYIKAASTAFQVGGNPVTLSFGPEPKVQLSDYVYDNNNTTRGPGLVFTVDGSNLPILGAYAPKITGTYSSKGGANGDNTYDLAGRAEITVGGLNLGLNAAREGGDGITTAGIASNNTNGVTTVFGANAKGTNVFGTGFGLSSEYATSSTVSSTTAANNRNESAFYARVNGALGPVTIENLNFRTISAGYDAKASISEDVPAGDNSSAPYSKDQTGFGVQAGISLGGFFVGGYYDQKTNFNDVGGASADDITRYGALLTGSLGPITINRAYLNAKSDKLTSVLPYSGQKFGVDAKIGTFAGFSLTGGADLVQFQGATVDQDTTKYLADNADGIDRKYILDEDTRNNFRVGVSHSGSAADALIKGLDLSAEYRLTDANYSRSQITARAAYTATLGPVTISPLNAAANDLTGPNQPTVYGADPIGTAYNVYYRGVTDSDGVSGTNGTGAAPAATDTFTRFAAGANVTVALPGVPIINELSGRASYYNTDHTNAAKTSNGNTGVYSSNELAYQVTARSTNFLFGENSTFAASYANYTGKNRSFRGFIDADNVGEFRDTNTNGAQVNLSGYYLEWNFFDANLAFGDFTLTGNGENNRAQAFRIRYRVSLNN